MTHDSGLPTHDSPAPDPEPHTTHHALIKRLLTPGDRLSQRVVHAGFWAFALRIVNQLFGLARTIVLARVLSPNDFGLFGIALLALSALETFSQTGFQQALIQKKGDVKPYLDTAWTVQVIRGVALAAILFGIAPHVAVFFGEPTAAPLLRVLGLSMVFQGLTNIGVVFFQKELEFNKQFIYMFSGTLADLGVAIPAALILRNAWALVFGLLAGNFVRMAVSYFVHPYRPRPHLERAKTRELYKFGRWILGNSIVVFLIYRGSDAFVGKVLGTAFLGLYQLAFRLSDVVAIELSGIFSEVTFPAYSKLQDQYEKLKEAFLGALGAVTSVSLPISVGLIVLGPAFVQVFLGEAWRPAIGTLQLLAATAFLRSVMAVLGALFRATGRPHIECWLNLGRLLVVAVSIYPLTRAFGLSGTAASVALGTVATIVVWIVISMRVVAVDIGGLVTSLVPSVVGTGAMSALIYIFSFFVPTYNFWGFTAAVAVAIFSYIVVEIAIWHRWHCGPIRLLMFMLKEKGELV